jgi:hypothetical protein
MIFLRARGDPGMDRGNWPNLLGLRTHPAAKNWLLFLFIGLPQYLPRQIGRVEVDELENYGDEKVENIGLVAEFV